MKKPQLLNKVVLQPTTLCNLNCTYCYLDGRMHRKVMLPKITQRLADDLKALGERVTLIWHGGEPLALGIRQFRNLIAPLEDLEKSGQIRHSIQTNATLITEEWCRFLKEHNFFVGVSIDGPKNLNAMRVDWANNPSFDRIIRGIGLLRQNSISFGAIAVVTEEGLECPQQLYDFFVSLGAKRLGINIVEQEGANTAITVNNGVKVKAFWSELFKVWKNNPTLKIREFEHLLSWMAAVIDQQAEESPEVNFDPFPTIGWDGKTVLLSPELLGVTASRYDDFVVGNILNENLVTIVERGLRSSYVVDFASGVAKCKETCSYYSFCKGGQASNKFFEHGTTNITETAYCRNSEMSLVDAVLDVIQ